MIVLFDRLIDVARKLDKADREALSHCGLYLTRLEQYAYASEVYMKMGDIQSLVTLHVKAKNWDEVSHIIVNIIIIYLYLPSRQETATQIKWTDRETHQTYNNSAMVV